MGMTLRLEDTGSSVKDLQTALNTAGYNLTVDGYFGQQTLSAVKDYQTKQGLAADGIVGSDLWNTLNGTSSDTGAASMSDALVNLMNEFNKTSSYTPKTAEQIQEQAAGEYKSYYDALRQGAQQSYDSSDLALQQQKEGLGASYDKLREDSAKQYAQAYSQTDRALLGRGMQRSSYGAQTLANILTEGAEAQQDIGDAQAAAEGNIDAQRALLAQQLAAELNQHNANEQADILARIRELEDQEYDRSLTSANRQDSIALQLYQLMYQEGRDQVSDDQWNKQFNESVRQYNEQNGGSSGGSYSGSAGTTGSSGSQSTTGDSASSADHTFSSFLKALDEALGGSNSTAATTQKSKSSTESESAASTLLSPAVKELNKRLHVKD